VAVNPLSPAREPALPCAADQVDAWLSVPPAGVVACLARHAGPFLVLGAGGKIGLHLCRMLRGALAQAGRADRVIAVSRFRTLRDTAEFTRAGIEVLAADLTDPVALRALPEAPTVFFLAGVKFGTADRPDLLQAVNVALPALVAERYAGSRMVAFSTGCVYPFVTPASGGATESTPPAPPGAYAASCFGREQAFTEASARRGTPIALLRLNYSTEFRYGLLVDIGQRVARGEPVDVTTGYANVIWQRDMVAYAIHALDVAAAPAVPLNVTGPEILGVRDVAREFGTWFGVPVRFAGTESATAWLNNASLAHRRFGVPEVRPAQMIEWIAAWLRRGGASWGKPTGFEHRDGRF
jgi:nucleoside-diphosphate-sugar epimerase